MSYRFKHVSHVHTIHTKAHTLLLFAVLNLVRSTWHINLRTNLDKPDTTCTQGHTSDTVELYRTFAANVKHDSTVSDMYSSWGVMERLGCMPIARRRPIARLPTTIL